MASYPLGWLADVLRDAGCTVVEEGDWEHHGRDGAFDPDCIMLHHDASPAGETSSGADVIINGRPGLAGPLSQLWLDYDGRWHVIAAGRANHAGEGGPWGAVATDQGNRDCIGIETDHTTDEHWSSSQRSEGIKGVAALCRKLGITTEDEIGRRVLAHKEYTSRKVDPDPLNMTTARANLFAFMTGGGDAPVRTIQKNTDTDKVLTSDEWKNLMFTDNEKDPDGGQWCAFKGPGEWFETTIELYAQGPVGARFLVRAFREAGGDDQYQYPIRSFTIPDGGTAHVELHEAGSIKDGDERLRVRGKAEGSNVTLTYSGCRSAVW